MRLVAGALLLAGLVLVGQGAWIKAKAAVAQILLERSFERSLDAPAVPAPAPLDSETGVAPFERVATNPERHGAMVLSLTPSIATPMAAPIARRAEKPWSWADIRPLARITANRLGRSDIVLDDASSEALAFGPGHLPLTPLPGEPGTSVLAGHRDTHFQWIRDLRPGDEVNVELAGGGQTRFTMRRAWIARFDASGIDLHSTGNRLALTTCWPFDAKSPGPLRYIVEFDLIDEPVLTAAN